MGPERQPERQVQFAVVREDPAIETEVVELLGARSILLVASGGCTALSLAASHPELEITLVDSNPAQLALVRAKLDVLWNLTAADRKLAFTIGQELPESLNTCGNFEALFRSFRAFLHDFVWPRQAFEALFEGKAPRGSVEQMFASRYWPVAFELFFSDPLLVTMFGPDAVQHAPKGSYPAYFRSALERGLRSPTARDNPFLHHILLGHYLDRVESLPPYLTLIPARPEQFRWVAGAVDTVPDLSRFDLIGLSNIFDWMPKASIERLAAKISSEARPGATVIFRQLNHTADLKGLFRGFRFDPELEGRLLQADRSLFYSRLNIGTKRGGDGR